MRDNKLVLVVGIKPTMDKCSSCFFCDYHSHIVHLLEKVTMAKFPTECCMNCKFLAAQPNGWTCAGFVYIKLDDNVICDNRKEIKPKGCPMEE